MSAQDPVEKLIQEWRGIEFERASVSTRFHELKQEMYNEEQNTKAPYPWLALALDRHLEGFVQQNKGNLGRTAAEVSYGDQSGFLRVFRQRMPFAKNPGTGSAQPLITQNHLYDPDAYTAQHVDRVQAETLKIKFHEGYSNICKGVLELEDIWNTLFHSMKCQAPTMGEALGMNHTHPLASGDDQMEIALQLAHICRAQAYELRAANDHELHTYRKELAQQLRAKFPKLFDILCKREHSVHNRHSAQSRQDFFFYMQHLVLASAWILPRFIYFAMHEDEFPSQLIWKDAAMHGLIHMSHLRLAAAIEDNAFHRILYYLHMAYLMFNSMDMWGAVAQTSQQRWLALYDEAPSAAEGRWPVSTDLMYHMQQVGVPGMVLHNLPQLYACFIAVHFFMVLKCTQRTADNMALGMMDVIVIASIALSSQAEFCHVAEQGSMTARLSKGVNQLRSANRRAELHNNQSTGLGMQWTYGSGMWIPTGFAPAKQNMTDIIVGNTPEYRTPLTFTKSKFASNEIQNTELQALAEFSYFALTTQASISRDLVTQTINPLNIEGFTRYILTRNAQVPKDGIQIGDMRVAGYVDKMHARDLFENLSMLLKHITEVVLDKGTKSAVECIIVDYQSASASIEQYGPTIFAQYLQFIQNDLKKEQSYTVNAWAHSLNEVHLEMLKVGAQHGCRSLLTMPDEDSWKGDEDVRYFNAKMDVHTASKIQRLNPENLQVARRALDAFKERVLGHWSQIPQGFVLAPYVTGAAEGEQRIKPYEYILPALFLNSEGLLQRQNENPLVTLQSWIEGTPGSFFENEDIETLQKAYGIAYLQHHSSEPIRELMSQLHHAALKSWAAPNASPMWYFRTIPAANMDPKVLRWTENILGVLPVKSTFERMRSINLDSLLTYGDSEEIQAIERESLKESDYKQRLNLGDEPAVVTLRSGFMAASGITLMPIPDDLFTANTQVLVKLLKEAPSMYVLQLMRMTAMYTMWGRWVDLHFENHAFAREDLRKWILRGHNELGITWEKMVQNLYFMYDAWHLYSTKRIIHYTDDRFKEDPMLKWDSMWPITWGEYYERDPDLFDTAHKEFHARMNNMNYRLFCSFQEVVTMAKEIYTKTAV